MPGPGAAGLRIFHDHLRMVVINLAIENPLGGVDDGFAAREHAVDGVTGVVPKGKADDLAATVVPSERVVVKGFVLFRGTPKQVDFLRIEHATNERVAFLPVFSESIWSDGAAGHKRSSMHIAAAKAKIIPAVRRSAQLAPPLKPELNHQAVLRR